MVCVARRGYARQEMNVSGSGEVINTCVGDSFVVLHTRVVKDELALVASYCERRSCLCGEFCIRPAHTTGACREPVAILVDLADVPLTC